MKTCLCNKLAITLIILTVVLGTLPLAGAQDMWQHFGCNSAFTSYNASETQITPGTINQIERLWGIGCDGSSYEQFSRSPVVHNSRLYAASSASGLQCWDAKTGEKKWSYGENGSWMPQPSVTTSGTVLYLEATTSMNYALHAVNGMSGAKLWEAPIQFDLGFSDTNVVCLDEARNQVLMLENPFEPDAGKLYALDLTTGQVNWYISKPLNGYSLVGDYLVRHNSTAYVGIIEESWSTERVGVINLVTQELVTSLKRPGETYDTYISSMTHCGDALAVVFRNGNGEPDGDLVIYNTSDNTVRWSYSFTGHITGDVAYNSTLQRFYLPTNPKLYAIDLDQTPGDIQIAWTHIGYDEIYSPSVAAGIVYFLSDNNAYALNENTGAVLRTFPLGADANETTQIAICDGTIFFSGNRGDCCLYAYGFPPPCVDLGVTLYMPDHDFGWNDPCSCSVEVCNPGASALSNIPLFVLLDIYGTFYFAPAFTTDLSYYTINPVPGWSTVIVLPEFPWPPGTGTATNLTWYAAMTNQEMSDLLGEMDTWTFGWH
ncbi:PQQ-binding-like beta-propeller repeat protein [bacterium]|nr:PQQ-binding-like beta-propeller repeat protein [bacterium]